MGGGGRSFCDVIWSGGCQYCDRVWQQGGRGSRFLSKLCDVIYEWSLSKRTVNIKIVAENFENWLWRTLWADPNGGYTSVLLITGGSKYHQKNCRWSDFKKWHINSVVSMITLKKFVMISQFNIKIRVRLFTKTGGNLVRVRPIQGPLISAHA